MTDSKIEKALADAENIPSEKPTIDLYKVEVERRVNTAQAVQFTTEVLVPPGTKKPNRQEDNIDFNVGHAVIHLRNGIDLKVNCNDWVVFHENGSCEIVKEADFADNWKVITEPVAVQTKPQENPSEVQKTISPELAKILNAKGAK